MKTHTEDGIISIQVIDGRMKFNADNRSVELNKGQILALHKGIQHSVLAVEETLFYLHLLQHWKINKACVPVKSSFNSYVRWQGALQCVGGIEQQAKL